MRMKLTETAGRRRRPTYHKPWTTKKPSAANVTSSVEAIAYLWTAKASGGTFVSRAL